MAYLAIFLALILLGSAGMIAISFLGASKPVMLQVFTGLAILVLGLLIWKSRDSRDSEPPREGNNAPLGIDTNEIRKRWNESHRGILNF